MGKKSKEVILRDEPKEMVIRDEHAKDYKRMDLAAEKYGVTVSYFKQLINQRRLTRYKHGVITFIDCNEFERTIIKDDGNHGAQAAPIGARK